MRLEKKSFASPDEVRPMSGKGRVEILKVGDGVVGKATFEPGMALVRARQAAGRHLQLPGGAPGIRPLGVSKGDDG